MHETILVDKSHLLLATLLDQYLMETLCKVKGTEVGDWSISCTINEIIYARQWIPVIDNAFIDLTKVDAEPNLHFTWPLNYDYWGASSMVMMTLSPSPSLPT